MKKILLAIIVSLLIGCTKGQKDSTYGYTCTSTYQIDPFNVVKKDTVFYNITTNEANEYTKNTTATGWYTTCERL